MERYTDTISGEELYVHKSYGDIFYYKDEAMTISHRRDGPSYEDTDGTKIWYVNNKLHRLDGPALKRADGEKKWYVDGVFIMQLDKNGTIVKRME